MWSAAACRRFSSLHGLTIQYKHPGSRKSGSLLSHSKMSARKFPISATAPSLRYVKVHAAVRRMILRAVDGLHHQAVGTRLQVVYFYFHSYGDHGISLLDEIIGANDFREEYLLVGRSLENAGRHAHNQRSSR